MTVALLGIKITTEGAAVADKSLQSISDAAGKAEKSIEGLSRASGPLVSALGAMGVAMGALGLIKIADNWSDLNSRVRLAAGGVEQGTEVMERLSEMARRTYSDLNQTTESYLNNATALRELGYNTNQTLDFTEALNNAFVVSGAKAQRAESVMNALGKSMAAGKLSGEDLNTVIQTGGRVAELLAKELNTTVAGLRELGASGAITDAFTLIRNSILQNVGAFDRAGKISESFAGGLIVVADNVGLVTKAGAALMALGIANYFSSGVTSITAYTAAQFKSIQADRASAIEKAASTQAELALSAARLKSAEAALAASRANGLVTASYAALNRELLAARVAHTAASLGAAQATQAVASMGVAATASSVAVGGLNTALSLVGGPVGLAFLALGTAFYNYTQRAAEAEAISTRYAEAIRLAGEASDGAAVGIERVAASMKWLADGATQAQRMEALNAALRDQALIAANMTEAYNAAGRGLANLSTYISSSYKEMGALIERFQKGELSAEQFNKELDRLARQDPDLSGAISQIQGLGSEAAAAAGKVLGLNAAMAALGGAGSGKGGRLNKDNALAAHQEMLDSQFKQMENFALRYGELQDKLGGGGVPKEPKTPKGGGSGGGKKSSGESAASKMASEMESSLEALKHGYQSENEFRLETYVKDMETLNWHLNNKKITEAEYLEWKDRVAKEAFENQAMGEEERLAVQHLKDMETLKKFLDEKKITEEEYMRWKEQATVEHERKVQELRMMAYADTLSNLGETMGSLATIIGGNNDKMLKAQKIFGAASALVSTYVGAAEALKLPFPYNMAAVAAIVAKGMGLVAAIKSGSSSGSGGGSVATPKVSSAAPPEQKTIKQQAVEINLHGEVFTKQSVADLMDKINENLADGFQLHIRTT